MKTYAGWQALFLSFFCADLYRDVAKNWSGVGYQYLFLLVVALSAITGATVQIMTNTMLSDQQISPLLDKWPALTMDNGKFSIDRPSPYIIQSGDYVLDFDTTPDAKFPEGKRGWFITNSSINLENISTSGGEAKNVFDLAQYSSLPKLVVDRALIMSWINAIKTYAGIVVFVVAGSFTFSLCLFQTVFYALAGMIAAKVMNVDLSYSQLVRITSVALTPVLILDAIIGRIHPFGGWWLCTILIAIGYIVFGVFANKPQSVATSDV
jgi:hypothetical protein